MLGRLINLRAKLQAPVSGSSLAGFRIIFGVVGVVSMIRLVAYGWIESLYVEPTTHLHYPYMDWVPAPGLAGMRALVVVVAIASSAIAVGYHTRLAAGVFVIGFGWIEFIDASTYLNHYWFMTLAGLLLVVAPSATCFAVRPTPQTITYGWVWLVRFQVGIVYAFAGIAKLDHDWLEGLPLKLWLPARSDLPLIGNLLERSGTALVLSWAGALFDCTIVAFLLWRRSRVAAWVAVVAFHACTWLLFPIGVFPWLMIGATTIFFQPDWLTRVTARFRSTLQTVASTAAPSRRRSTLTTLAAAVWVALMLAIPARAWLIPGDAEWTGEGYRFAWNVLLTEKGVDVEYRIVDRNTGVVTIESASWLYTPLQWKVMAGDPELIRQTAHTLAARQSKQGIRVAVYADVFVSLNGRPAARLIDPSIDLSGEPYRPFGQPWILAEHD